MFYAAEYDSTELIYETDVETTDADIEQLKNLFNKVDSYIGLDGSKLFDEELARENNESQEIIDIGLAYNEMIKLTDTKELSSTDFLTTEIGAEKEITEKNL